MIDEIEFKKIRREIQGKCFKSIYNGETYLSRVIKVKQNDFNPESLFVYYEHFHPKGTKGIFLPENSYDFKISELNHFYNIFGKRIKVGEYKKALQSV